MDEMIKILEEIYEYMMADCSYIEFPLIVDKPKGNKQHSDCDYFEFEYVEEQSGNADDCYSGNKYFPLPNGKYISVSYIIYIGVR